MAPPEEANSTRASTARAASRTLTVPRTLISVVAGRRIDREPDVDLGREVADQFRPGLRHDRAQRGRVADSHFVQNHLVVQAPGLSGRQVVGHVHLVAPGQERIGKV